MSDKFTKYSIYNRETGEILNDLTRKEKKTLDVMQSKINVVTKKKNDSEISNYINEILGSFNHLYYNNLIDKEYIFRFIYLCTYINYKGYVELGQAKKQNKLATKKDLFEIFNNLSRREIYNTINYFTENELIVEEIDGYIKINDKIINKGKLRSKKNVTRIFNETVQELYSSATPKEHKKLSLLIKILPFINFHYNVLCTNPEEENVKLIKQINLTELASLLGYSTTQRLKKDLFDLKVKDENVIMINLQSNKNMIYVNPRIYYKGNNVNYLNSLILQFDMGNN